MKVKYVKLHTALQVPNAGDLGFTLPTASKAILNLKMSSLAEGVAVSFAVEDPKSKKKLNKFNMLIPMVNIKYLLFDDEETDSN